MSLSQPREQKERVFNLGKADERRTLVRDLSFSSELTPNQESPAMPSPRECNDDVESKGSPGGGERKEGAGEGLVQGEGGSPSR